MKKQIYRSLKQQFRETTQVIEDELKSLIDTYRASGQHYDHLYMEEMKVEMHLNPKAKPKDKGPDECYM